MKYLKITLHNSINQFNELTREVLKIHISVENYLKMPIKQNVPEVKLISISKRERALFHIITGKN